MARAFATTAESVACCAAADPASETNTAATDASARTVPICIVVLVD
jgi:hypothetical protein